MSWLTPVARILNQAERTWLKTRSIVIIGTALAVVLGIYLAGSYVYFVLVEKPEQRRLYQQTLKDRADWQRGDAERERAGNQAMAEWQECQKHHPEMRPGNPCPEPLTTYSYAVPATR